LSLAEIDNAIQGYSRGVFWERNTLNLQMRENKKITQTESHGQKNALFEEVL
jgi:hypothetical protein